MKRIFAFFVSAIGALATGSLSLADTYSPFSHALDTAAVVDLIAKRPVWCIGPSESGRSCRWAARVKALGGAGATGGLRVGLTEIVPAVGSDGRHQRSYTDYRFELGPTGLCANAAAFAKTPRRWVHTPHLQLSRVDGEVPIAIAEQRDRNAVASAQAQREHDRRGLMPGDRFCLRIARRVDGGNEFDIIAVFAPETPRESFDSPESFAAYPADPGWRLGTD